MVGIVEISVRKKMCWGMNWIKLAQDGTPWQALRSW